MGYSRAVRTGTLIAVSGTLGRNANGTYPPTMAEQTRRALEIIQGAIEGLGGTMDQVIRTRMFVTDISRWQEIASIHGTVFAASRPASALLEVARLIDPEALIEIEADAVVE